MTVPMKAIGDNAPTRSFHRPVSAYVNGLSAEGFAVDAMLEIPDTLDEQRGQGARAGNRAAARDSAIPRAASETLTDRMQA